MGSGFYSVLLLFITLINFSAQAGIVIAGTRVVYPADKKEVTVSMKNTGRSPALVQSWIDTGDPTEVPQNIQVPFVLTPPIARIDGGKGQTLRLMYTGGALPQDRESVFWLNVLVIPPKTRHQGKNHIDIAWQTRVKLFYRPASLAVPADDAPQQLRWKKEAGALTVHNPTPYYITVTTIGWTLKGATHSLPGNMLMPYSSSVFPEPEKGGFNNITSLFYQVINDQGSAREFHTELY